MQATSYIIRGGVEGRERQRLLSRLMRPTTLGLFERIGLRTGLVCLDVGCGGGDVTFDLARIVGAAGRVLGIDIDETVLELTRGEAAALRLGNVEFRKSGIMDGDIGSGFDIVYARFLLTHLNDPLSALVKMGRALKPGGLVVVEDIDFTGHFCHPKSTAFWRFVELYSQTVRRRDGDPNIGPRLPRLLIDLGCEGVQINVVQPAGIEGEVKLIHPITMESITNAVLASGLSTQKEVEDIITELYKLARDSRTVMSLPRVVQAWGCWPASGSGR